jgi:hypothetical protein
VATPTLSEEASFDGACAISPNDSEANEKGVSDALDGWMRKKGASRGSQKEKNGSAHSTYLSKGCRGLYFEKRSCGASMGCLVRRGR